MFKIDTLEKKNKQLITENEAIKRENKMLRENNIKFQLAIYDLENQDKPNQTKQHENYVVVQELKSPALSEVMNETTAFVDEFEVFDHASDVADEFEAVEHKPKMSNYSMERQKDIIDKYSISMEDTDIYQLDNIEEGSKNDQKFINKLLLILFDRNTLAYSSVSGKTNKNNKFQSDRCQKLDTNKVDFIKGEFY